MCESLPFLMSTWHLSLESLPPAYACVSHEFDLLYKSEVRTRVLMVFFILEL